MQKLKDNEDETSSKISDLTSQLNNLQGDISSLHSQKNELEEQIIVKSNEASTRVESNTNEVNVLQQEVESLQHQKSDLEEEVGRKALEQERLMKDKENLTLQIRKLELEMSTVKSKNSKGEEQIRANIQEISDLQDKLYMAEIEGSTQIVAFCRQIKDYQPDLGFSVTEQLLQLRNWQQLELGSIRSQKKREVEEQLRAKDSELNTLKQSASEYEEKINAIWDEKDKLAHENLEMEGKIDHLERKLATREFESSILQDKLYKVEEEHAQTLTKVDNEKNELANKNMDLQSTLKEREDAHQKLSEEYKQVDSWFNEYKVKLEVAERKMEEMAEEFREGIGSKDQMVADLEHLVEDLKRDLEEKGDEISTLLENVRNLEVKLRGTEQLRIENEESFRKAEEKFQQDQRALEVRIATAAATMAADKEAFHETITNIKEFVNNVISGIDTVSLKFSDDRKNIENRISNISHELQVAKEYVSKMNREKGQLQKDKNRLLEELQGKMEEELILREKVEKLEAKARKEESEKMNVTATVVELKKRVEELEKLMKEKEEGLLDLGEEKREAIRQLCLWIDYHHECNDYLKEIILKTRRGRRGV